MAAEISEDQFKPLRLMNGLYLQLHAYMLRVAVPYGTLNSRQMRMLATIARKYDRGYGHFTTRQNIQYNWIKLEDAPEILADLATVEMHAIQTSGNLHPQHLVRSICRGRRRRDRRSAPMGGAAPPVEHVPPRVQLSAAQVQDRGDRRRHGPRRDAAPRYRPQAGTQRRGRARLRGLCRRRHGAHADGGAVDQAVRLDRRVRRLSRGLPAGL